MGKHYGDDDDDDEDEDERIKNTKENTTKAKSTCQESPAKNRHIFFIHSVAPGAAETRSVEGEEKKTSSEERLEEFHHMA